MPKQMSKGAYKYSIKMYNCIPILKQPINSLVVGLLANPFFPYLILIGFFLEPDRDVAGVYVNIDLVIASDAPAALLDCRDALELQLPIFAEFPILAGC